MIKEHDRVVLKKNIPGQGLNAGLKKNLRGLGLTASAVGTVVHVYKRGEAFEVEFLTLHGETVCVATLEASQVRPVQKREITHARLLPA